MADLYYVLAGMAAWQFTAASLEDSAGQIVARRDLIGQAVYPIEIIAVSALVGPLVGFAVIGGISLLLGLILGLLSPLALLLPIAVLIVIVGMVGASWIFSVVGAVLRDLRELLVLFTGLGVFVSPVFVGRDSPDSWLTTLIAFNPLSYPVFVIRGTFVGEFNPFHWSVLVSISTIMFAAGAWMIGLFSQRIREYV